MSRSCGVNCSRMGSLGMRFSNVGNRLNSGIVSVVAKFWGTPALSAAIPAETWQKRAVKSNVFFDLFDGLSML